jgi:hypothetical protein
MQAERIWPAALGELQLQMTQATFDAWLRDSRLVRYEDGVFVVGVKNNYAKDWIENRLLHVIKRTLARLTGQEVEIEFSVLPEAEIAGQSRTQPLAEIPMPGPGEVAIQVVQFDPTKRGYLMTPHYAVRFWQPYLTPVPFGLWMTLCSYAYTSIRDERWPSVEMIADICAKGNRSAILGRNERRGRTAQTGAATILERENIIQHWTTGAGRETRHWFRVLESLPLLTPAQVQALPSRLQEAHERFIMKSKIDFDEWQRLTAPTLAAIQPLEPAGGLAEVP